MGKEQVYRIYGIHDWDTAAAVERAAASLDEVVTATVADTGSEERWEFLRLEVSDKWNAESEQKLAALLNEKGWTVELPPLADRYVEVTPNAAPSEKATAQPIVHREVRKVSMSGAIAAVAVAVIIAVLMTFSLTVTYQNKVGGSTVTTPNSFPELTLLDRLFRAHAYYDVDDEQVGEFLLNAYVAATGDRYAAYYNAEELKALQDDQNGSMCGIGITVVYTTVTFSDVVYKAAEVSSVYVDSPAEAAGLKEGDLIMAVGKDEDAVGIDMLGYEQALDQLKGEEGTFAEFVVCRITEGADLEVLFFSIERKQLTTQSVTWKVCDTDQTVGVIRIAEFDNTTATQFRTAVEELKAVGCTSFVFDLRKNPGGLLTSVEDVLTYFLKENDVMISTRDRSGNVEVNKVTVKNGKVTSGSGTLTADQVGMYRDLSFVVLVNQYTASAGELFTANMRDHGLAKIVGVTTYGKGSMQAPVSLSRYGYEGALKLTVALYDPPSGAENNYDGIGIEPDHTVALSEEALKYNFNRLPHDKDNQLQEAIRLLK